jgi:hypothetical protein
VASVNRYVDQRSCYFTDNQIHTAPLAIRTCKSACDTATGGGPYLTASPSSQWIDSTSSTYSGSTGWNGDMPQKFCPQTPECQFNHIMWYTTKNRKMEAGVWKEDGNLISPQSSAILQWSEFVR